MKRRSLVCYIGLFVGIGLMVVSAILGGYLLGSHDGP